MQKKGLTLCFRLRSAISLLLATTERVVEYNGGHTNLQEAIQKETLKKVGGYLYNGGIVPHLPSKVV